MPNELKPCPFCGGKAVATPFIYRLIELPKPIKLFGRWSLIKMRYREIPTSYTVECDDFCDGFMNSDHNLFVVGSTEKEAVDEWNRRSDNACDVAEVKHGRWQDKDGNYVPFDDVLTDCPEKSCYCSECGKWLTASDEYACVGKYCPNCGAKMDGGIKNG